MYCCEKTGQLSFVEPMTECPKNTRLWRKFLEYHSANPNVYEFYKQQTLEAINSGRELYSSKAINEYARWNSDYRVGNNYTAYYARLFIEDHPQYKGFFKLRAIKTE